jgi:RNA polymerase sigma factor (sigma-70 family)
MGGIEASTRSRRRLGDWDEIELIECICEGTDAEVMGLACAELFRRHDESTGRAVESAFRRSGLPLTDVEDVVNVIRLRIVESLPELRERSCLRAWCRRLARNAAVDHIRSLLRRRFFDVESLGGCCGEEEWSEQAWLPLGTRWDAAEIELIEGIDLPRRLERALAALAPRERQAFHLFYEVGLKYQRIAERMGIVSDTVGALLSGAREKFFRAWADGA